MAVCGTDESQRRWDQGRPFLFLDHQTMLFTSKS